MWIYKQSNGQLWHNSEIFGAGYSGHGEGKNNPACEAIHDVGPIPVGLYRIGPAHISANVGPCTMALDPIDHDACGRTDFRIHGDSIHDPGGASHGCIIFPRKIRELISASDDKELEVIA